MKKILQIIASPRGADSKSKALSDAYIQGVKENNTNVTVETIELWQANLPEFDGNKAAAKMTFFGDGEMNVQKTVKVNH